MPYGVDLKAFRGKTGTNLSLAKRDFDKEANSWDDDPLRVKLANDIFTCISQAVVLLPGMDILDFGCGTGLVALQFQPHVRSITGIDSSVGMLEVFKKKVAEKKLKGIVAHHVDFDQGNILKGQYHLIIISMALHHIKNVQPLLDQFYRLLQPSGCLCIVDLDIDHGKFHDNHEGVFHHGFDRVILRNHFEFAGFKSVCDLQAAKVIKNGKDGVDREFSIFLMMGRKS